jgi:hypothetical protein
MAAKKKSVPASEGGYTEFGASGLKQYSGYVREEWLPSLIGRKGLLVIKEMRDNDPIVGAIFFAIEMLLRGVNFTVEGADTKAENQQAADFVESCLGDMEQSWSGLLAEILNFLVYGFAVHETVYKLRRGDSEDPKYNSKYNDGLIGWRKHAGRGQETLLHWVFDESGDAIMMVQLLPTGGPLLYVPLEKCLHFRTTPSKNNPEGRSIIRNAYTSYYYKKVIQEIEAIGVSRDLTGMPVAYVPAKWTTKTASPDDKAAYLQAKSMVRDVSRNQQEGLVVPTIRDQSGNLDFELKLLATGGRRQIVTNEIIDRYDHRISATVLADFITLGSATGGGGRGSFAMSKGKIDIFSVAVVAFLDMITAEFNRKAIPDLLRLNGMKGEVQLVHGDIQRRDLQELGTYLLDAFGAGTLTPDAALEAHVREEGGLPALGQAGMRDLQGGGDASGEGGDNDPADTTSKDPKAGEGQGGVNKRRAIRKRRKFR